MDERKTRTEDFAKFVGISNSAIRMWYTGYARPDIEKIPAICKFFNVSSDYLLGMSPVASPNLDVKAICEKTGLSPRAVEVLIGLKKIYNPLIEFLNSLIENDYIKVYINRYIDYIDGTRDLTKPCGCVCDDMYSCITNISRFAELEYDLFINDLYDRLRE